MQGRVGQRILGLGQSHKLARMVRRHRQRQRKGVGEPHVFACEDNQPPRDEARVLAAREHLDQPVKRGVGIRPAAAFDEGRNRVVVFVLIGVVTDTPFARKKLQLGRRDRRPVRQPRHDDLEGVQRAPQIAFAQAGEVQQHCLVRRAVRRAETAIGVGQRTRQHRGHSRRRERLQPEQVAAREQRRVHVESRVMRRRTDQADVPFLNVGQQQVLLGFVKAVQLVNEEQRRLARPAPCRAEYLAQLAHIAHHGVDPHETAARHARNHLGEACFSTPWRPVKH